MHDVGHLVAALTAADVDDDVGVAPLGHLLQEHGLSGAEAARHGSRAAPRHGVEQVEHTLAGVQADVASNRYPNGRGLRTGQRVPTRTGSPETVATTCSTG